MEDKKIGITLRQYKEVYLVFPKGKVGITAIVTIWLNELRNLLTDEEIDLFHAGKKYDFDISEAELETLKKKRRQKF